MIENKMGTEAQWGVKCNFSDMPREELQARKMSCL